MKVENDIPIQNKAEINNPETITTILLDVLNTMSKYTPPVGIRRGAREYEDSADVYRGTHFWRIISGILDQTHPVKELYQQGGVYVSSQREVANYRALQVQYNEDDIFDHLKAKLVRCLGFVPDNFDHIAYDILLLGVVASYMGINFNTIEEGGDIVKRFDPDDKILIAKLGVEKYSPRSLEIIQKATGIDLVELDARIKRLRN